MKITASRLFSLIMAIFMTVGFFAPMSRAFAADTADEAVAAVTAQLEAIDTLQQIQSARYTYTVTNRHCDVTTTSTAVIEEHETARAAYETYVSKMFAARLAAQQAYDALTDEQKAQIDPALAAKLSSDLPTVFKTETYSVTPRDDEYAFEAVKGGVGLGYEVSHHMVSGNIPQTFILVDTSNGETSWTPSGRYVYGESNYEVTYCCDVNTPLTYASDYKRINLEDSGYYDVGSAQKIRAILQNAYPFVTMEEMKAGLIAGGLDAGFVAQLTRADIISAVQMAVWTYANAGEFDTSTYGYFASVDTVKNTGIYFYPLHDYTNECWDWLPGKRQRTYDARAAYRVNALTWYLCNLDGVEADPSQIVISNVKIARAELVQGSDDTYQMGMYCYLNGIVTAEDDLTITATSYTELEDGTRTVTDRTRYALTDESPFGLTVNAKIGDTIEVVVNGVQNLPRGVYFYDPEDGRDSSQSLVGVAEGETRVYAREAFVFREDIGMGLRIYKTEKDTQLPLSDITFHLYGVTPEEGEVLGEQPTEADIAKYAVEENLVASIVTDATGYAAAELAQGSYLVVEEHNAEKIIAPVAPFYIHVPMPVQTEVTDENGDIHVEIEYVDVVSAYPKNEPVDPPPPPTPPPPPPSNLSGRFTLLKHEAGDETYVLEGAQFQIYRSATAEDAVSEIILCDGIECAVVPVTDENGQPLILTTGADGTATSPELDCGVYFALEIKAPNGYNLLDEAICITVSPDEVTAAGVYPVPNIRGNILPETGGKGTATLLTIGGVLTLAAVILLVTKKRMSSYE